MIDSLVPTLINLFYQCLPVPKWLYPLFGLMEEMIHHCILSFPIVSCFWSNFLNWWCIHPPPQLALISDLLEFSPNISNDYTNIYQASPYMLILEIWSWRNRFHSCWFGVFSLSSEWHFLPNPAPAPFTAFYYQHG